MPEPRERDEILALARELLARLSREDLTELSVRRGGVRVHVRRDERGARVAAAAPAAATLPERAPETESATEGDVVEVKAPLTGIFYRSPSPQAPPYVQAGSTVSV